MRKQGPLTDGSCFPFESSYSHVKKAHKSGTASPAKQALENLFLRLDRDKHTCQLKMRYIDHLTTKTDDSLAYHFDTDNGNYTFYKIHGKGIRGRLRLRVIQTRRDEVINDAYGLDISKVGVFKRGKESGHIFEMAKSHLSGKALCDNSWIMTVPVNVARDR